MSTETLKTQNELLENYLRGKNRSITAHEAETRFGILNLRARVTELRQAGLKVTTDVTRDGRAKYFVASKDVYGSKKRVFSN
jgi:hypothetical protein